ncbi:MAG: hypothetical protein NTW81_04345, partial [Actinobacteria bacterium]|nr:hypothetical protein [Actinomycetota bacterium]
MSSEQDKHTTAGKLAKLQEHRKHIAQRQVASAEKQQAKGKLSAMERILHLLDEDSFQEIDALARHRSTNFGMEANVHTAMALSLALALS